MNTKQSIKEASGAVADAIKALTSGAPSSAQTLVKRLFAQQELSFANDVPDREKKAAMAVAYVADSAPVAKALQASPSASNAWKKLADQIYSDPNIDYNEIKDKMLDVLETVSEGISLRTSKLKAIQEKKLQDDALLVNTIVEKINKMYPVKKK